MDTYTLHVLTHYYSILGHIYICVPCYGYIHLTSVNTLLQHIRTYLYLCSLLWIHTLNICQHTIKTY